jgi:hypothetical protein
MVRTGLTGFAGLLQAERLRAELHLLNAKCYFLNVKFLAIPHFLP